ncbi:Uncharacterised protein [Yersinia frederiksenii]|uniref:hypothetical protein n=1 Tax=Yersinia frederiksenii TaxID=29484 RepID=UPI0005DB9544|nr:hypothetical protein [Yersinia frederiksenii]CND06982.1 Uncharacterised protein [Yersinia frederiksenii]
MEVVIIVLLTLILIALVNINQALSKRVNLTTKSIDDVLDSQYLIDIKDEITSIRQAIEDIKYTTDIIENYKLPSQSERQMIDQIRVDDEISEMLDAKRNASQ